LSRLDSGGLPKILTLCSTLSLCCNDGRLLDDKCGNVVTENKLYDAHKELHEQEAKVSAAFEASSMSDLQIAVPGFLQFNENHLKVEEVEFLSIAWWYTHFFLGLIWS
jgi:hypothetical protein